MCGICGQIRLNDKKTSIETVRQMTESMAQRGPDAMGLHVQGKAALGHRRLKIIDLSERAQQPMADNFLGLTIVYNGAVYNYASLRTTLESKGYRFFSSGDTEVILKAYHAWGAECVKRFNGMFAFVIVHRDEGKVFAARDRFGIKPLYYYENAGEFRFASTLPALLAGGGIETDIDPVALNFYMMLHSIVPAPRTILRDIKKLSPGATLTLEPGRPVKEEKYWELSFIPSRQERHMDMEDWKASVMAALRKSVAERLTADVPVGVLLSGGIDSSLITGILSEMGQPELHTFSIGFANVNGEKGNEFPYSDIIAHRFGTTHHKIQAHDSLILSALDHCIQAMSEPMVSHDCIGFYLLSEAVSKHVKVVQSGQGADEVFGGYSWYPPLMDEDESIAGYVGAFFDRSFTEYAAAVNPRFIDKPYSLELVEAHFAKPGARSIVDKALRIDTTVMLVDDPVKRLDNMSMAWGLEARVPFLDHDVVELAAKIPAKYKVPGGGKYVLKEAARDLLPSEVIDRPKGYFPVPALKYLSGEYLGLAKKVLHSKKSRERGIFNPGYVEEIMSNPVRHITPLQGSKLWQMALLEYWLTLHGI